jgi:hypothetical protein
VVGRLLLPNVDLDVLRRGKKSKESIHVFSESMRKERMLLILKKLNLKRITQKVVLIQTGERTTNKSLTKEASLEIVWKSSNHKPPSTFGMDNFNNERNFQIEKISSPRRFIL